MKCKADRDLDSFTYHEEIEPQTDPQTNRTHVRNSCMMLEPVPLSATEDHIGMEPEQRAPDQFLPQFSAINAIQSSPSPTNPLVPPRHPLNGVAPSGTCWEPSLLGHEEPEALPLPSVRYDLLQPFALAPVPALIPSLVSAWTIGHSASLDSLGASASPGLDVTPAAPWTFGAFTALRPSTLLLRLAPPSLSLHLCPRSPELNLWPSDPHFNLGRSSRPPGSSPSLQHLCSLAARWAPSTSSLPSVIPMVVPISTPPWLLPPAMPVWGTPLTVAWITIQHPLFKAIPWLFACVTSEIPQYQNELSLELD
ncbi:hypothetical protein DPX16_9782 [Anabarilius grahami]|uniref:Uncharacterized protein n=1 Tax=Anabarilius grahami TaxID=495550 RepID=A0A3N0Y4W7_ANAGA|nr:hypothetical protein DPX16_9782 [Anabarilius grahami]